eukprot:7000460-Pyramimonas_sp.AAC.1
MRAEAREVLTQMRNDIYNGINDDYGAQIELMGHAKNTPTSEVTPCMRSAQIAGADRPWPQQATTMCPKTTDRALADHTAHRALARSEPSPPPFRRSTSRAA